MSAHTPATPEPGPTPPEGSLPLASAASRTWLRALPAAEPPPAIDTAILRAARSAAHVRALHAPAPRASGWTRWLKDLKGRLSSLAQDRRGGGWQRWPLAGLAGSAAATLFALHFVLSTPTGDADRRPMAPMTSISETASALSDRDAPARVVGGAPAAAPRDAPVVAANPSADSGLTHPAPAARTMSVLRAAPAAPSATSAAADGAPVVSPPTSDIACEAQLRRLIGTRLRAQAGQLLGDCQARFPEWQPPSGLLDALRALPATP